MGTNETELKRLKEQVELLQKENQALKEDRDKYHLLIDNSSDPIFSFSKGGVYTYVNKRFASGVGFKQDFIIGKKIWDVFSKDEADKRYAILKKAFDTGEKQVTEVRVPLPEGDTYYITSVAPQRDQENNIHSVLCISKDITSRKRAELKLQKSEQKLRIANATKDKFFSIIAHDLKNPFNAILGFSEILASNSIELKKDKLTEVANAIHDSGKNAYRLLENLLEWSLSQTGNIEFKPEKFLVSAIVNDILNLYAHKSANKNINIQTSINENLYLNADKNMIHTVVRNLISNALKFTNEGGSITISSKSNTEVVTISIKDSGIGMNESQLENLFNITNKTSTPGTDNETGTGLGLILCKEFVEKHGGTIKVKSKVNEGSEFRIIIPLKSN